MYINVLAILLLFIAVMTIYNGLRWVKESKGDAMEITLSCIQIMLGGLLIGIVYFAI